MGSKRSDCGENGKIEKIRIIIGRFVESGGSFWGWWDCCLKIFVVNELIKYLLVVWNFYSFII